MKKIAILIFALFIFHNSHAQIVKGSVPIAGSISYNSNSYSTSDSLNTSDFKNSDFGISPEIGYFVANNFAIGASIKYYYDKSSIEDASIYTDFSDTKTTTIHSLQFSPFAARYFKVSEKFYFSLTATFGYGMPLSNVVKSVEHSPAATTITENKGLYYYSINADLAPGLLFFINEKFAIQASMGSLYYNYEHRQNNDVSYSNYSKDTGFGLNLSMASISLGVQYLLVKK
jgi:outer membrane immunogenic protein